MAYTNLDLSPYSSHLLAKKTGNITSLNAEVEEALEHAMFFINEAIQAPRSVTGGS